MPHIAIDKIVDTSSVRRLRTAHTPCQCPVAFSSRRQALVSITTVSSNKGIVSTRNAGAIAAPAEAVPIDESTAGITHHQGSGRMGASTFARGVSILNGLIMSSKFLLRRAISCSGCFALVYDGRHR